MLRKDDIAGELTQLAFDYFYWFSRFEFCLKENGFLQNKEPGAGAEPGWNEFVATYAEEYELSAEALLLLGAPPDRQVVGANDTLAWRALGLDNCRSDLERVVRSVKTVRNNLFHGGKHGAAGWDDVERMRFLITNSQSVLEHLVDLGDLRRDYERMY